MNQIHGETNFLKECQKLLACPKCVALAFSRSKLLVYAGVQLIAISPKALPPEALVEVIEKPQPLPIRGVYAVQSTTLALRQRVLIIADLLVGKESKRLLACQL